MLVGDNKAPGSVTRQGNELIVAFAFTPRRYKAIRSIGGARYHPATKTWRVPLQALKSLEASYEFSPQRLKYEVDVEVLSEEIEERDSRLSEARAAIRANPFSVSATIIEKGKPDVSFHFSSRREALVAKVIEKKKTKHFFKDNLHSKIDSGFLVSAPDLPGILIRLRDKGILFAVESSVSDALKATAEIRRQYFEDRRHLSAESLKKAFMLPFIGAHGEEFTLYGAHEEYLKKLLPKHRSLVAKRDKARSLTGFAALEIVYNSLEAKIPIWISSEAETVIRNIQVEELHDGFDDVLGILPQVANCKIVIPGKGISFISQGGIGEELSFPLKSNRVFSTVGSRSKNSTFPKSRRVLEIESKITRESALQEERAALKALIDVRDILSDKELEAKLFPHQRVAVQWLLKMPYGLLGDDMGLGKTLSVLAAFSELFAEDKNRFLLVVTPASLVQNWRREVSNWIPQIHLGTLPQVKNAREKFLQEIKRYDSSNLAGLIVSLEEVRLEYVYPVLAEILSERRGVLCVDESQRVKNHKSKGFQALHQLAPYCEKRWLLSGTPIPRDISDIWSQVKLLDGGERLGRSFYGWLKTVAELGTEWSAYGVKRFLPEQVEKTIETTSQLILRRKKEEVVDLPEKLFHVRELSLSGDQKHRYDEVRKDLVLRLRTMSGEEFYRQIDSILEQYLRAVQIASNPRLVDPEFKGDPVKFLELDEIVEEIVKEKGEKIVLWTNYRANVDELVERYKQYGALPFSGETPPRERQKYIEEFQSLKPDSAKILVAIPAAGGVGITLTAAQTAVYIDKTWNAEHWLQSVDRIHRIGQTGTVNIISLQACRIDKFIASNLEKKQELLRQLFEKNMTHSKVCFSKDELLKAIDEDQ